MGPVLKVQKDACVMSNKFVRVVAIVLAVLMAGGVFAAVLQVFAVSPEAAAWRPRGSAPTGR